MAKRWPSLADVRDHIVLTGDYDWNSGAAQRTTVRPLNLYRTKIRA